MKDEDSYRLRRDGVSGEHLALTQRYRMPLTMIEFLVGAMFGFIFGWLVNDFRKRR